MRAPSLLVGALGRFDTHQATNTSQGAPLGGKRATAPGLARVEGRCGVSPIGYLGRGGPQARALAPVPFQMTLKDPGI